MNTYTHANWITLPVKLNINCPPPESPVNSSVKLHAVTPSLILIRWATSSKPSFNFQLCDLRSDVLYSDEFDNFNDISHRAAVFNFLNNLKILCILF